MKAFMLLRHQECCPTTSKITKTVVQDLSQLTDDIGDKSGPINWHQDGTSLPESFEPDPDKDDKDDKDATFSHLPMAQKLHYGRFKMLPIDEQQRTWRLDTGPQEACIPHQVRIHQARKCVVNGKFA